MEKIKNFHGIFLDLKLFPRITSDIYLQYMVMLRFDLYQAHLTFEFLEN